MAHSNAGPKRCQVKVCGIREPAEAAALDAMGVDWIGFNFHPGSKRYVTPEAAAPQIRALSRALPVGVFVDADPEFVIRVTNDIGLRYLQLHGGEGWDYIRRMPVPVIKALPHDRLPDLGGLRAPLEAARRAGESIAPLAYFLVDTASGAASAGAAGFGGSGKTFDWALLAKHPLPLPFFLAGGIGPQNLEEALTACSPFAVDLNSKVEISPARKDMDKVRACLDIVSA
jgi:phosphoribosylanthranilate isomerase